MDHKEAILFYARDFEIPFDNNEAERNIRNFKAKLKISGCFRTSEGANNYAKIMSFLITAKKNSINTLRPCLWFLMVKFSSWLRQLNSYNYVI